jgi:hypothetical protein
MFGPPCVSASFKTNKNASGNGSNARPDPRGAFDQFSHVPRSTAHLNDHRYATSTTETIGSRNPGRQHAILDGGSSSPRHDERYREHGHDHMNLVRGKARLL